MLEAKKHRTVRFRVSDAEYEKLKALAKAACLSVSSYIRHRSLTTNK